MNENELYEQMEARLTDWAYAQPGVHAVILIGSRARVEDHPADAWSDLDTIAFVEEAEPFQHPGGWYAALVGAIGKTVWFAAFDRLTEHEVEWEVVFEDGSKLDMVFSPSRSPGEAAGLAERIARFPFRGVLQRGMRVLVDKFPGLPVELEPLPAPSLPDADGLEQGVNAVLLDMFRAWKLAERGELWRAARAVNHDMHNALLRLIGWHALAVHGRAPGPYGRFLEEWADPNVLALLEGAYAKNTRESVVRALRNTHRLLSLLVTEMAEKTGLPYPASAVDKMGTWVE